MQEFKSQKIKAVIKDLLKKKDITYEDLAEQMECSVPTIKRILGPEELTLNRLLQLCEIVNIDLAELEALSGEEEARDEKFTEQQEAFLAKNQSYFAYLMKLFGGETPKQIAEKYGLTQRSTDKYLIGLEKQGLIRVTGKQKVKPAFSGMPSLGNGVLAKVHYESFIKNAGQFFVDVVTEGFRTGFKDKEGEKTRSVFRVHASKISRASFEAWAEEQEKAMRQLEKLASFEEKTKDPSELMTTVIIQANTLVKNDYKGLELLESTMGTVTNL
ncbi:helix-turn-helix domain-containing protein [Bdellovibrio sp. HCB337]|uniref:helix-turn-helix domain-containing protein n=1 Tax=Bdellovibrio sp. HCB337 TaxID=3394358 RepID=UPI0039A67FFB